MKHSINPKQPLSDLVYEFLEALGKERRRTPSTVTNYGHYLMRFLAFIGDPRIDRLTIEHIWRWQRELASRGLKASTQNYHIIAIRSLLRYGRNLGLPIPETDRVEIGKQEQAKIEVMTLDEFVRLLQQPDTTTLAGLRDRAILELLYGSGLRISELVALDRNIVRLDTREFTIRGKGGKLRMIFVTESAVAWITHYLAQRELEGDESRPLFVEMASGEHGRLQPRSIQRILKHYVELAGITKHITPHGLRHLYATQLLKNGADIRAVQELLGHQSILTTQRYTHVTNEQLKNVHERFLNLPKEASDDQSDNQKGQANN